MRRGRPDIAAPVFLHTPDAERRAITARRASPGALCLLMVSAGGDTPAPEPPWEARQWIAFGVYVVLLVALVALAWRLARPEAEP